jgi:hypothetical protein
MTFHVMHDIQTVLGTRLTPLNKKNIVFAPASIPEWDVNLLGMIAEASAIFNSYVDKVSITDLVIRKSIDNIITNN